MGNSGTHHNTLGNSNIWGNHNTVHFRSAFHEENLKAGGRAGGNTIYVWHKEEGRSGEKTITGLQLSLNDDMEAGLTNAGYKKFDKDLSDGEGGDRIYFWFLEEETEYSTPIVDIEVTTDADAEAESQKFSSGWEILACDLNRRAGRNRIHGWVKREKQTYICDVTASDSYGSDAKLFQDGYIRVDENTNRDAAGGADVFIWYRQTTDPQRALKDLQISTNDSEYQALEAQNYKRVNVDLNKGTKGGPVYLWYKQEGIKPIKAITMLSDPAFVEWYEKAGANVIKRNLNTGNGGSTEYLCFYQ